MRIKFAVLMGLTLCLTSTQIRADEQSKLALAHECIKVAHVADAMRNLLPIVLNNMKPLVAKQPGDDATKKAFFDQFQEKAVAKVDELADQAAQVYADTFSEEDLTNLITFYKSPTGQKLIAKQTYISTTMARLGRTWGTKLAAEVLEDYAKELAKQPNTNTPAKQ